MSDAQQGGVGERVRSLRTWRVRERELGIADTVRTISRSLRAQTSGCQRLAEAWVLLAPPELVGRGNAMRLSRGVLVIESPDAAFQHQAARWLRGGGAQALQRGAGVSFRRWRFCQVGR